MLKRATVQKEDYDVKDTPSDMLRRSSGLNNKVTAIVSQEMDFNRYLHDFLAYSQLNVARIMRGSSVRVRSVECGFSPFYRLGHSNEYGNLPLSERSTSLPHPLSQMLGYGTALGTLPILYLRHDDCNCIFLL
ncbi:hypothetical protein CHS0354_009954 [Potamilus streckersoni]|uniref:Uncharacterized protein n=1 Tax=Potamilus streckersoni TaxID=2493646 RepID=A0AAE0TDQ6_9BIVA|nr:hypothetical protein CHS0354_009954 [Potamilus streckersoni]